LINEQSVLLSNGKQSIISSIKSLQTERIKLQFMCEDDKYEQDKFQKWNQHLTDNTTVDEQDTDDNETDADQDDDQVYLQLTFRHSIIFLFSRQILK
jgi:hypothetical protein